MKFQISEKMKLFLQRLLRFFTGPKIGDIYVTRKFCENPFDSLEPLEVLIVDKRNKWVQYKYLKSWLTQESRIINFKDGFKFVENSLSRLKNENSNF